MFNWLNETKHGKMVRTWLTVFVSYMITAFIADGANIFAVDSSDLTVWLSGALTAVLPLVIVYLNPKDDRYGVGS